MRHKPIEDVLRMMATEFRNNAKRTGVNSAQYEQRAKVCDGAALEIERLREEISDLLLKKHE